MMKTQEHWERVYSTKRETEVSWYQAHPEHSLELIRSAAPDLSASILDVGGGASRLVDELIGLGYSNLTVLDVSHFALDRSKARLGRRSDNVSWIVADVTQWKPERTWDVWHDRAVFHFLTTIEDQNAYITALEAATKPGSSAIISTFALDGPDRCSGLPVQRYSPASLAARIGSKFEMVSQTNEAHTTPGGTTQLFSYALLKRR
jgi:2-polyprenyl-3-methyl-5-hydroxy-6-metoxy-1,4-benzoquinol methylase